MKVTAALPQFVRDLLASVPRHGEGVHAWLFRVARVLHPYRSENEIVATLEAAVQGCGRVVRPREIADAVRNSKAAAWQLGGAHHAGPARTGGHWPQVDRARRQAIVDRGSTLYDLWEASPVRFDDDTPHTESVVDTLFPGNPWLCVGANQHTFQTRRREALRGTLAQQALLVPSPMTGQTARTQEGKESEHTLAGTGPRRYLVVEFDTGTADEHAALLLHLARYAPLALAVHSAGKSLHGWFHCGGAAEETALRLMRHAVSLGADGHLWLRSQFARMPDGTRDNGRRQTVFFFNPGAVKPMRVAAQRPQGPQSPRGVKNENMNILT
jgi:hypothetical protein